jgi:3-oxoacyl-[acyl-carrier protein] reductase
MKLIDKVAIVTGGGRDIGKAISLKLAAEGAKVAINFSGNEVAAQQTLEEVQAAGGTAILVRGDMTRQQDVDDLVAQSQKAFGERIDILANVVGGLVARKTIDEIDEAFFNLVIRLN